MAKRKHKRQREIRTTRLDRLAYWDRDSVDMDARTVSLAFSSEQPVSRWFGDEILDHSKGAVRLDRLRTTGPLLLNHDSREHIGTIESASIDKDRVGRAVVRFGKGKQRDAILSDIEDGIRRCVSVGYRIHRMKLEEGGDEGSDVYRATDWEPYEVSLVSMPADTNVGVGRAAREWQPGGSETHDTIIVDLPDEDFSMSTENKSTLSRSKQRKLREAATAERTRIRVITEGGEKYGLLELAAKCIEDETSLEDFNRQLLDSLPAAQDYTPEMFSPETHEPSEPRNRNVIRPASGWETPDGKPVPVLRSDESVTKRLLQSGIIPTDQQGLDVGDAIRAMITGIWPADGALHRALAGGTDASGGWWLTPVLSSQIIDLARAKSVLMDAGAQTVLMSSSELAVVRVTAEPAIGFVAENQTIPEVEPTFGRLTFRARKLAARVKISKELAMDAPNAAEQIRTQLAVVLGVSLDLAALVGTGDGEEVVGIFNHDDVQEMAAVGGPTFDDLIDAIQLVEDQNGISGAYILPPAVKNTLAKLKDSQGNYLQPPVDVTALKRFVTKQLADSQACLGDFTQVLFGVREAVQIEVSTQGADSWERDQVEIMVKWRGDVQLSKAAHLVRLIGIT